MFDRSEARVPSLYIDGQWVAAADDACSSVVNPSDATVVTDVDVATDTHDASQSVGR